MRAELSVQALPELVRTARLTAGQAARQAGVSDDAVEDVRVAVGVAAARAVGRSRTSTSHVRLEFFDGPAAFTVRVHDDGAADLPEEDDGLALAVLEGMADRFEQEAPAEGGTVVTLSWPLGRA